jgi:Flp pilus assembly protein TadD
MEEAATFEQNEAMQSSIVALTNRARLAVRDRNWPVVAAFAKEILRLQPISAEGHFLLGLVEKASNRPAKAREAFEQALQLDSGRYDVAVELANQYSIARRNGEAAELLARYENMLAESPLYLDIAGTVYTEIGLPQKAYPLYKKAVELQPGVDIFRANLASSAVYAGLIDEAREIYLSLLERFPDHRRNHYYLSRLERARDDRHLGRMLALLESGNAKARPEENIFLYYAIAKELEDLQRWDEAFKYYKLGGDAVTSVADYDVAQDVNLIQTVIEVCDRNWLGDGSVDVTPEDPETGPIPVFIVGLPRTGTTLTERILASHSQVESLGETLFLQLELRTQSGVPGHEMMTPKMLRSAADKDPSGIAAGYMHRVAYRLGGKPYFIDKLPFNFLYLGFIARAWPHARIVHLVRNPMDACFSMYKQLFTWAYKFSYSLDWLGQYYVAHHRLQDHWQSVLGDRIVEVSYEALVSDPENQTRMLLKKIGLEFEPACLDFHKNRSPSTTASSVQIRERAHSLSVDRWKHFADHLVGLREQLEAAGIVVES